MRSRARHALRVDDEVKLVVEDMQRSMDRATQRRCTANEAIRTLLSHRQPGGFGAMVERAALRVDKGKDAEWL